MLLRLLFSPPISLSCSAWLFRQYFLSLRSDPHSLLQHYLETHHTEIEFLWINSAKIKREALFWGNVFFRVMSFFKNNRFSLGVGWNKLVNFGDYRESLVWDGVTQGPHNVHVGVTSPRNPSSLMASVSHGPMGWKCFQPNLWDCLSACGPLRNICYIWYLKPSYSPRTGQGRFFLFFQAALQNIL